MVDDFVPSLSNTDYFKSVQEAIIDRAKKDTERLMKWLDQAEEDLHTGKEKEEQDEDSFEKLSKEDFDRKVQE